MKKPENLSDNIFILDSLAKKIANVNQKIKFDFLDFLC